MNILFIANCLSLYGANRSMLEMMLGLKKNGQNVYVAMYEEGAIARELRKANIEYVVINYPITAHLENSIDTAKKINYLLDDFRVLPKFKEYLDKWNIDIIHSNASNMDIGQILSLRYNIPHVWHVREMLYSDYQLVYDFPRLEKWLLAKADSVIAISDYVKTGRNISNSNVVVMHDGLDVMRYSLTREKKLFENDCIHMLFCGAIMESKGVMDAVRAIEILVNKYHQNVELKIAGAKNGIYPQMMKWIRQRKLTPYITCVGHCNDLSKLRTWADIALVCSKNEALGRVSIEGMLSENLVIGAKAGGTAELIQHGYNGYLYSVGNFHDLARKVVYAKEHPDECITLIGNAKKYALENFDDNRYAEKMIKLYKDILCKHKKEKKVGLY